MASRFESDRALDAKLRPYVLQIYRRLFAGSTYESMGDLGDVGLEFDKHWGIDGFIRTANHRKFAVQSKCRRNKYLIERRFQVIPGTPDFTQEYMNAVGTPHKAPGEWFHLNAEIYFFGWATSDECGLEKWLVLDIPRYKRLVEEAGGLNRIGKLQQNNNGGKASFYAIPITRLRPAWVATYREGWIRPIVDEGPALLDDETLVVGGQKRQANLWAEWQETGVDRGEMTG